MTIARIIQIWWTLASLGACMYFIHTWMQDRRESRESKKQEAIYDLAVAKVQLKMNAGLYVSIDDAYHDLELEIHVLQNL